jgi:hypothetical protein
MLKRFIFWDYPRGSPQYDVIVALILAFVFLTPRGWFRDQPRIPNGSSIAMLPSEGGSSLFWVDAGFLANIPENQRRARLTARLRQLRGTRDLTVTRVEPILDSEGDLRGYMAFAR